MLKKDCGALKALTEDEATCALWGLCHVDLQGEKGQAWADPQGKAGHYLGPTGCELISSHQASVCWCPCPTAAF